MQQTIWAKTWDYVLDLIYPKECVSCGVEGSWLCSKCQQEIITIESPFCPKCKRLTQNGQFCRNCRKNYYLTGIIIAGHFKFGPLREAIHTYKYDGVFGLEKIFRRLLICRLKGRLPKGEKVIIPIPLHRQKEVKRGFNQAERLAKLIAKDLNLPIETKIIKRIKETRPQINLKREERFKNIKDAFKIINQEKVENKTVLLVDDVTTTGMTLNEAAKVLRKAGAKEIWGVVIAQG
jgi:ComF family protein